MQQIRSKGLKSLDTLPNIGSVTALKLRKIGITTVADFLKLDPYDIFDKLRTEVDPTLCRCALAVIVGANEGKPWHKITKRTAREYERRHPYHRWGKC
jgi:RecG-like helicase